MDPEGARLLAYFLILYKPTVSLAYRLCINIHHYGPPREFSTPPQGGYNLPPQLSYNTSRDSSPDTP